MKKQPNKALVLAGMGFELFAMGVAAIFLGPLLDKYFGLNGLGLPIILFLLFFGWVVHFVHLIKNLMKNTPPVGPEDPKHGS